MPSLTPLQRDVLVLLVDGLANWEIATRLDVTPGRVGTQIGRIVQRLGLTRRADIAARLTELDSSPRTPKLGHDTVSVQAPKAPGPWSWRWLSTAFLGPVSASQLRRARRELRGQHRLPYHAF